MQDAVAAWAASGAMALTGRAGEPPLGPPAPLIDRLGSVSDLLRVASHGSTPRPIDLLGERSAIAGLSRHGPTSCGGSSRLLLAADGWIAVTLARDDDLAAVPAWLELDDPPVDVWSTVEATVARRAIAQLDERAALLGLPASPVGCAGRPVASAAPFDALPVHASAFGPSATTTEGQPLVVDLSSLWAGPLCGHLLHLAGCRVVKVESCSRPDGARLGPRDFFDLLNGGKASVALALDRRDGVAALDRLVRAADVVIESSRPRALRQLGIAVEEHLAAPAGPRVWISITGHGRDERGAHRVGFGDDAAAAGGLVVWDQRGPCFCADAIADPLAGVVAAAAALVALQAPGRWLLDVAMADVAAWFAGPTVEPSAVGEIAAPFARPVTERAAALGRDTAAVLAAVLASAGE